MRWRSFQDETPTVEERIVITWDDGSQTVCTGTWSEVFTTSAMYWMPFSELPPIPKPPPEPESIEWFVNTVASKPGQAILLCYSNGEIGVWDENSDNEIATDQIAGDYVWAPWPGVKE